MCLIKPVAPVEYQTYDENDHETYVAFDRDVCYFGNNYQSRMHNPRRCYDEQRFGRPHAIQPVDGQPGKYQIVRRLVNNDEDEKYMTADPTAALGYQLKMLELN